MQTLRSFLITLPIIGCLQSAFATDANFTNINLSGWLNGGSLDVGFIQTSNMEVYSSLFVENIFRQGFSDYTSDYGHTISYNDGDFYNGIPAQVKYSASHPSVDWIWGSGGLSSPEKQMRLSNGMLSLFDVTPPAGGEYPGLVLNSVSGPMRSIIGFRGENVISGWLNFHDFGSGASGVSIGAGPVTSILYVRNSLGGKVGIGVSDPAEKLDVSGNIRLSGNIVRSGGGTVVLPTSGTLTLPAAGGSLVTTSGTQTILGTTYLVGGTTTLGSSSIASQQVKIDASGNVGIGTAPSTSKLTLSAGTALVGGDATAKGVIQIVSSAGSTEQTPGGIEFKSRATGAGSGFRFHTPDNGTYTPFYLQRRSNSATWTTDLTVSTTGNVGIGTIYPGSKLTVGGEVEHSGVVIQVSNNKTSGYSMLLAGSTSIRDFGSTYNGSGGAFAPDQTTILSGKLNGMALVAGASSAPIKFLTAGYAASNERMRIASDGSVGVGTTTPAAKLDVNGTVQISGDVKIKNKAVIRVSKAGDLGMGLFTAGVNPEN